MTINSDPPPPGPWQQPNPGQPESGRPPNRKRLDPAAQLDRVGQAPMWLIAAGLAASALLQLALRTRLSSLATLLAVVVLAGLVLSAAQRRQPAVAAALGIAVVAAGVAVLRASPWVTVPALALSGSCVVLAGQGRMVPSGLWQTAARYVRDTALSVQWLAQPLRAARGRTVGALGRSVVLAAVAVVPLALLLASADPVFGQLLTSVGPGKTWQHVALSALVLPFVAAVALAARRPEDTDHGGSAPDRPRSTGRVLSINDATVVLGSVGVLLAVWGATQVVVALGGADRLLATANLTAAENARQGFFQLVAATALLVGIIVVTDRLTPRQSAGEHLRFLGLTVLIGAETLGVVVATYARLALYVSGFGNTMLRLSVAWFLAWLAVVMLVLVVSVNRSGGGKQFSTIVFGLAALWILAFGVWNPEAAVARSNMQRAEQASEVDIRYLGQRLGPDAMPTLVELAPTVSDEQRAELTEDLCRRSEDLGGGYRLFSWNRSHDAAAQALETLGC